MIEAKGVNELEATSKKREARRTLILNIDRDADIEEKADTKTPIIGRQKILDAAKKILMVDPEEADGNALYASVKIFDGLESMEGQMKELAAISGSSDGGLKADRKLAGELEEVLERFPADDAILVTDGYDDEGVIPIVNSYVKIASIQHVVIKHSKSVEETYAVIGRYLKTIWTREIYRRYVIGVPGLILLFLGVLALFGQLIVGLTIGVVILGAAMIFKGFGIDEYVASMRSAPAVELLRAVSLVMAVVATITGAYLSYANLSPLPEFTAVVDNIDLFVVYGPFLIGKFLQSSLGIFLIGWFIYVSGILLRNIAVGEGRILRHVISAATMIVLYFVGNETASILIDPTRTISLLIFYITIGLVSLFFITLATYVVLRRIE